jgi:cytochrome P450
MVYLRSHPFLFALLSATRRAPSLRIGRTVLVHGTDGYVDGLTRVRLDRTAPGSTGGIARAAGGTDVVFDENGPEHRATKRDVNRMLAVPRLAPLWRSVLRQRLQPLATGGTVDVVAVATELTGVTTAALLGVDADPVHLAETARRAAADAARDHFSRRRRKGTGTARELVALAGSDRGAMLAVAAVNTMVAALPRAVAWCADDGLWDAAADDATRPVLVDELLRVLAPSPLLPRVAADDGDVAGRTVRRGDRLILVARHAARAHRAGPSIVDPAPPRVAQAVFGAGPHACPGTRMAKAQLADALEAFAAYRPVVVRAKADRRAALPGWSTVEVRAG